MSTGPSPDVDDVAACQELVRQLVLIRVTRRLSQQDVAGRMGMSQPAVSKLENDNKKPTLATVQRYARAVGARLRVEAIPPKRP